MSRAEHEALVEAVALRAAGAYVKHLRSENKDRSFDTSQAVALFIPAMRVVARAAIAECREALREPTEEMVEAYRGGAFVSWTWQEQTAGDLNVLLDASALNPGEG